MIPGYTYEIINNRTKMRYIGSTTNTAVRFASHLHDLSLGQHQSVLLQRAWATEHSGVFSFNTLGTYADYDQAFQAEQSLIRALSVEGLAYNSYVPSLDITTDDRTFTPEHRAALSASLKAHWDTLPHAQRGRTTCSNGHQMSLGNTHVTKAGRKVCRACHRDSCRASAARRRDSTTAPQQTPATAP